MGETPKSYYDEYIRKKGITPGLLSDPPSLLTDRGAYVNFLQTQLERVSSACLSTQAYESRFNDMQALIVALEERCGNTTRLVALAQQCTEELRTETHNGFSNTKYEMKREINELQSAFKDVFTRLATLEQNEKSLKQAEFALESRTKKLEDDKLNKDDMISEIKESTSIELAALTAKLSVVTTDVNDCKLIRDDLRTVESSLTDRIASLESNVLERQAYDRDEFARRITQLQSRLDSTNETNELKWKGHDELIKEALDRGEESLKRGGLYRDRLNEHFDMLEKLGERTGFIETAVADLRREEGRPLEMRLEATLGDRLDKTIKQRMDDLDVWSDAIEKRLDTRVDGLRALASRPPPVPLPTPEQEQQREDFIRFMDDYEAELGDLRSKLANIASKQDRNHSSAVSSSESVGDTTNVDYREEYVRDSRDVMPIVRQSRSPPRERMMQQQPQLHQQHQQHQQHPSATAGNIRLVSTRQKEAMTQTKMRKHYNYDGHAVYLPLPSEKERESRPRQSISSSSSSPMRASYSNINTNIDNRNQTKSATSVLSQSYPQPPTMKASAPGQQQQQKQKQSVMVQIPGVNQKQVQIPLQSSSSTDCINDDHIMSTGVRRGAPIGPTQAQHTGPWLVPTPTITPLSPKRTKLHPTVESVGGATNLYSSTRSSNSKMRASHTGTDKEDMDISMSDAMSTSSEGESFIGERLKGGNTSRNIERNPDPRKQHLQGPALHKY